MSLCRFYQQGTCRYGNNCRFEHGQPRVRFDDVEAVSPLLRASQQHSDAAPTQRVLQNQPNAFGSVQHAHPQNVFSSRPHPQSQNQNLFVSRPANNTTEVREIYKILIQELDVSEQSRQWPLSCLNPIPSRVHGNIPGLEDHSPEELRCLLYEARVSGAFDSCKLQIDMLHQQAQARKNALKTANAEILSMLETLMRGPISTSQQPLFPSSGVAHDSWPTSVPSPQTTIFSSSPSIFGGSSQQPAFGAPQQTSVFGRPANTTPTIFGGSSSNQPPVFANNSSAAFGSNCSTVSLFGGTSSQTPFSSVGQNTFSGPSPASNFTFKLPEQIGPGASSGSSIFGGQLSTGQNVFNSSENEQKSGIFSGFHPVPSSHPNEGTSLNRPTVATAVGAGVISIYSDLSTLTPDERREFSAATFTVGCIPIRPPPKELCD